MVFRDAAAAGGRRPASETDGIGTAIGVGVTRPPIRPYISNRMLHPFWIGVTTKSKKKTAAMYSRPGA
jgi:hypothetical protein